MKTEKLNELVDELTRDILEGEETAFHYELCPYFKDCPREVGKICLNHYDLCSHYLHLNRILKRR